MRFGTMRLSDSKHRKSTDFFISVVIMLGINIPNMIVVKIRKIEFLKNADMKQSAIKGRLYFLRLLSCKHNAYIPLSTSKTVGISSIVRQN